MDILFIYIRYTYIYFTYICRTMGINLRHPPATSFKKRQRCEVVKSNSGVAVIRNCIEQCAGPGIRT